MTDLLLGLAAAGLASLALQIADAVGALVDAATVRDSDDPDALTRRRAREVLSTVAVVAVLAVLVAFAVDRAAAAGGVSGLALLLLTAAATFAVGTAGALATLRRERPTYARLRRDLRDRSTLSIDAAELAEFDARLERADRVRARRPQIGVALRLLGVALVATVAVSLALADPGLLPVVAALTGLHVVATGVALRAALVRRARLEAVLEAQRAEVAALLERARIPQRGSVPGLRDRVSRALAILREKQR